MEIRARINEGVIILDLSGRIDVNSANFIETVGQCLRDRYFDILCNFEDVGAIDYMGISVIVIAYKEVANAKGRMKFCAIPAHLQNSLAISGLDAVIDIAATEEIALNSFKEDKIIEDIQKMQLRRRFKRLPIDIKIELKGRSGRDPVCMHVDTLNLSAIGAYIYGCDKFKLGDEVSVKFKLLPKNEEIELEAKVVWISDKQFQPHFHPGMGIEFRNMSAKAQEDLVSFIERNLSFLLCDE